jgi:glycosyltransferase involved in cell wall biosynthesis
MKVLHVIDKSFLGGGQAAVRTLIASSPGTDVECELACREGGPLVGLVRDLGVPVHPVPFDKHFRPGPARRLAELARTRGIDLLHGHGLVATTYATLARSFFSVRLPLVYQQHGFHHHNYGPHTVGLRRAAERAVCWRADKVVSDSRSDEAGLLQGRYAPPGRVETVYTGIPEPRATPEEVEAVRREFGLDPRLPVVGLVARLHPQKGVDVFLEAAARVREAVPGCQFVVLGGGELEGDLRRRAAQLGLEGAVRWAGGRPDAPFLPIFTVAVITSLWEGIPLILLEYMATGRPVVTTALPGCLEALGEDAAEVVRVGDPDGTAAAVLRLLREPDRAARLAATARARYEERFTPPATARRFAEIYRELAG